jgi:hypothetical protein
VEPVRLITSKVCRVDTANSEPIEIEDAAWGVPLLNDLMTERSDHMPRPHQPAAVPEMRRCSSRKPNPVGGYVMKAEADLTASLLRRSVSAISPTENPRKGLPRL